MTAADGMEFICSHGEGRQLGRVAFHFPAQESTSDDGAAQWAAAVRGTFEPLVERKVTEVTLPPQALAALSTPP